MTLADSIFKEINSDGKRVYQVVLISDDIPTTLPTDGTDVKGMEADYVFAPGSLIICVNENAVYLAGEDGTFVLQE